MQAASDDHWPQRDSGEDDITTVMCTKRGARGHVNSYSISVLPPLATSVLSPGLSPTTAIQLSSMDLRAITNLDGGRLQSHSLSGKLLFTVVGPPWIKDVLH